MTAHGTAERAMYEVFGPEREDAAAAVLITGIAAILADSPMGWAETLAFLLLAAILRLTDKSTPYG